MLSPVGSLPARVYWRRRLVFVGLPLVGIILVLWAALSGGGSHPSSRATASTTTKPSNSAPATSAQPLDTGSIGVSTTTPKPTTPKPTAPSPTAPSTTAPSKSGAAGQGSCAVADLTVAAATDKKSFAVNAKVGLSMLVTNTAAVPCHLDVADKHVEWRVYVGDARIWGSNDCAVRAGSQVVTLAARQSIPVTISWSGLTSAPKCAGPRLALQTGTYKLFAYVDNKASVPVTFTVK